MKKAKKILAFFLVVVLCMLPLKSYALEMNEETENIETEVTDAISVNEKTENESDSEQEPKVNVENQEENIPPVIQEKVLPNLMAQVHVQDYGWMSWKKAGEIFGTTGQKKRMEAIKLRLEYAEDVSEESQYIGDIEYRVHVQDYGWLPWKKNGDIAGTVGEKKRIEAIQIRLTGEMQQNMDVYYRIHSSYVDWLGWAKNGSLAGTETMSQQAEAMELCLMKKGEEPDFVDTEKQSYLKGINWKNIFVSAHIQNIGDTLKKNIQNTVGTLGESKRLEGIKFEIQKENSVNLHGGIKYRVHVQDIGWQNWKNDSQLAGTIGQKKRIEAIEIKLTEELAKYYDIYYRAHVQNLGWLGWAKNGQSAGTSKMSYRLEALQLQLIPKGEKAPGNNTNYYKEGKTGWYYEGGYKFYYKNGEKQLDLDGILPKQSSYYIKVNRKACTVTVYAKDGNNGYIIPVKRFACSVGKANTPTPVGTFYTPAKYRWHTLMGPSYGQYCTRITKNILFHSVAGKNMTSYNLDAKDYNMLGQPASHGCVRLCVRDAKWIYDNCVLKTKVTIYDSNNPGPLGKPSTIKIPMGQTWDPTDPNVKH